MATYATPGVIIEEITGPGVIAGVGTSTAGFIGPALWGPLYQPTQIFSWEEFVQHFGKVQSPGDAAQVFIGDPRSYLANAVQGFFDNGGSTAWIVRVGTAARAYLDLDSVSGAGAGHHAVRIEALAAGMDANLITVAVSDAHLAPDRVAVRPTATISGPTTGNKIVVTDALTEPIFKPGDVITLASTTPATAAFTERQVIDRIDYTTGEIFLTGSLVAPAPYTAGTVRMDTLRQGRTAIRLAETADHHPGTTGLYPGSVVQISRTAGTMRPARVAAVRDDVIHLEQGLTTDFLMTSTDVTVASQEFKLTVQVPGESAKDYDNLSMSPRHPRFYEKAVDSKVVRAIAPPDPAPADPPGANNAHGPATATVLAQGADDDLRAIGATHYNAGIDAFEPIDDVNFISMPDVSDPNTQADLLDHCDRMQDRVAIMHVAAGRDGQGAKDHRAHLDDKRGFGALYYPWITIRDPLSQTGDLMLCPPDGHLAGIYARVDTERGVHKAPANELVRGAVGLERLVSDAQQAVLNVAGINVIRTFPGQARPIVWGARTTVETDITDWRYINVRRLLCYIEESIQESLRWAVFEPNDIALWQKLIRTTTAFLRGVWRDGALFGATVEEAFLVRCDAALNPPETRALGQLHMEIRVAPVRPAEFIVVRISLWDGGSEATE